VSRPLARGWATVEIDRAAVELADRLRPGAAFEPVERSAALGARCVRGAAVEDVEWIVLLEPDTEGRLAGYLARHGEGWAATWLAADEGDDRSAARGGMTPGPFGREWLEVDEPRAGPFRLRVSPATIEP
jgi:hypothetical protein